MKCHLGTLEQEPEGMGEALLLDSVTKVQEGLLKQSCNENLNI